MGKYVVRVPYLRDQRTDVMDIEVDVQNPENAIPQAKARNTGPGYLWEKAEVLERDSYQCQRARIVRIASELAPSKAVEFDEANTFLKFRIRDAVTRTKLTNASGEWIPSELADKSDDWLRAYIKELGQGKI